MAAENGYVGSDELRARYPGLGNVDTATLDNVIEAASRAIDEFCGRRFWLTTPAAAKTFAARCGCVDLAGNDIATTTGLVVKTGPGDGTWPTTIAATGYLLLPLNGEHGGIVGHPYTAIRSTGLLWPSDINGRPCVQITAQWGWSAIPRTVQHVAGDLARRALFQELGVQSESTGAYQVAYDFVGLRDLLSSGQKTLLRPYHASARMTLATMLERTATVQRRGADDTDAYGNQTDATVTVEITNAYLEQTSATDPITGRRTLTDDYLLILPAESLIDGDDRVIVDGVAYHVQGLPHRVRNPRTQQVAHVECTVRRTVD